MPTNLVRSVAVLLSMIATCSSPGSSLEAESSLPDILVNTTSDIADFGGMRQVGDLPGADGLVSLREAIIASNNTAGPQVIGHGEIDTPNPETVTIEFFANAVPTPGGDPSGHGEGEIFLGTGRPSSRGRFTVPLPPLPAGMLISATATDANGNTSELAANIMARHP